RLIGLQAALVMAAAVPLELFLQIADFRALRVTSWEASAHAYDREIGWVPEPRMEYLDEARRPVEIRHNGLGLRDIEFRPGLYGTMLVLGDSLVYGTFVEEHERFTDILRAEMPGYAVVNAGAMGYGTDQEYLMLRRLWDRIRPDVVVLMFCTDNDRRDNTHNVRHATFKPYIEFSADGVAHVRGQPVPKSKVLYIKDSWLARRSKLVRLVISLYVELRNPRVTVPDNTERLVGLIQDFVESRGGKFLVGLQRSDDSLEAYLRNKGTPFVSLDAAPDFTLEKYGFTDFHWSPEGHAFVADRLMGLLRAAGVLKQTRQASLPR